MTAISDSDTNITCFLCGNDTSDDSSSAYTCEMITKEGQRLWHRTHTICGSKWAIRQRDCGRLNDQIVCNHGGSCPTNLSHLLPPPGISQRTSDFFKTHPTAALLASGAGLLAMNLACTAASSYFGTFGAIGLGLGSMAAGFVINQPVLAAAGSALIGGASGAGMAKLIPYAFECKNLLELLATEASKHGSLAAIAGRVGATIAKDLMIYTPIGVGCLETAAGIGFAGATAAEIETANRPRPVFSGGATTATIVGISTLINGGGAALAGTLAALTFGTYSIVRSVTRH